MQYKTQIALDIFIGKENPEPLADKIGVKPESIAKIGSRKAANGSRPPLPRQSYISYRSIAKDWNSSFFDHWQSLKDQLWPKRKILSKISKNATIKITIIVKYNDVFHNLIYDRDFIGFASEIGAVIDVDTYDDREYISELPDVKPIHDYQLNLSLKLYTTSILNVETIKNNLQSSRGLQFNNIPEGIVISSIPQNGWESTFEEHWQCFAELVNLKDKFNAIYQNSNCIFEINVEDIARFPSIYMEPEVAKFINDINATVIIKCID